MKKRVFVLEDNLDLIELFTILLEDASYQVSAFATVSSFKEVINDKLPDIFLLDIMLPDGNGAEICEQLKSSPRTKHIPVILMSANNTVADIKSKCQAEDFIEKPFDIDVFIDKVNQYVN